MTRSKLFIFLACAYLVIWPMCPCTLLGQVIDDVHTDDQTLDSLHATWKIQCGTHDYEKAINTARKEVALVPKNVGPLWVVVRFDLAESLRMASEYISREPVFIDEAIALYQEMLPSVSRDAQPVMWAWIQYGLGSASLNATPTSDGQQFERAISALTAALDVFRTMGMLRDKQAAAEYLGDAYHGRIRGDRIDNLTKAIEWYSTAIDEMPLGSSSESFVARSNLATIYIARYCAESDVHGPGPSGDLEHAMALLREALKGIQPDSYPLQWSRTTSALAFSYANRLEGSRHDNSDAAIRLYKSVLAVLSKELSERDWAYAMAGLGNAYIDKALAEGSAYYKNAREYLNAALTVYTREKEPLKWAETTNALAIAQSQIPDRPLADRVEASIATFQLVLDASSSTSVHYPEFLYNLGQTYRTRIKAGKSQNMELAIKYYTEALAIFSDRGDQNGEALCLTGVGDAYRQRILGDATQNLEQAIQAEKGAQEIIKKAGLSDLGETTAKFLALAYLERRLGDRAQNIELAIDVLQRALPTYDSSNYPALWADLQSQLGTAYAERIFGDIAANQDEAISHFRKAETVQTQISMPEDWAMTKMHLAEILGKTSIGRRQENLNTASTEIQGALQVFTKETFPSEWASAHWRLGSVFASQGVSDQFVRSLEQYELALTVYTRAANPENWAQLTLQHAYISFLLGNRTEASIEAELKEVTAFAVLPQYPTLYRELYLIRGLLSLRRGAYAQSAESFSLAIRGSRIVLQTTFTERSFLSEYEQEGRLYSLSAFALAKSGQLKQALETIEEGKARLLRSALGLRSLSFSALPVKQRNDIETKRASLLATEAALRLEQIDHPGNNYAELAESLYAQAEGLQKLLDSAGVELPVAAMSYESIRTNIKSGMTLVAPIVTDYGTVILIVPHEPSSLDDKNLVLLPHFTSAVLKTYLFGTGDNSGLLLAELAFDQRSIPSNLTHLEAVISATCDAIGREFMQPLYERLISLRVQHDTDIVIMPDGALGLIPLGASRVTVDGSLTPFLSIFNVTYAPSSYALGMSEERASRAKSASVLIVADPLGDLPIASIEADGIAALFESSTVLKGERATKQAVVQSLPGVGYVHFATHGYYDWRQPEESSLMMAQDQRLPFVEILSGLDVSHARLVTLSACATGLNEPVKTPDEYIGLPTAFLEAGAAAVVSTLWQVNDLSTGVVMSLFYEDLVKHHDQPRQALRRSQNWLRSATVSDLRTRFPSLFHPQGDEYLSGFQEDEKPFNDSYYWGAFYISGW